MGNFLTPDIGHRLKNGQNLRNFNLDWLIGWGEKGRIFVIEMELKLNSPAGAEPVFYTWPLSNSVRSAFHFRINQ